MALKRENILSLIGSRRYHSCISTTFSFDFYFFEMKAMKWLRSCGVRNINVFVDGHYYSEVMNQLTGDEMRLTPGYSLQPVFKQGIFHPKIWMLFGEKEGLLIVGSGNLTNSGNGNNDEIWGAFHFDIRQQNNIELFSAAWNYVSQLSESATGIVKEKTGRWILDHSRWLLELPKKTEFQFVPNEEGKEIAFLYNDKSSIWKQMIDLIPANSISEISVVSPFYDVKGKALVSLSSSFPNAILNVVIDESGSIPSSLETPKGCSFYSWKDIGISKTIHSKSEITNGYTKLHGKIIHFKTKGKEEFCLLGSANCTPEGLGLPGSKHINSEASILIRSKDGGLMNDLGLKFNATNRKPLSEFKASNRPSIFESIIENNRFNIRLLSAERLYNEISFFTDVELIEPLKINLFNHENRLVQSVAVDKILKESKIKIIDLRNDVQYMQLVSVNGEKAISNKILVADYFLIAKTHPNPKTEDVERIYSEIQNGELERVLDLLNYAIFDESEREDNLNLLSGRKTPEEKESKKPIDLYDLSSYKEVDSNLEKNLLFSSVSLRVLDVLKFIHSRGAQTVNEKDLSIDEQEVDLGTIEGNDQSELQKQVNFTLGMLKSERRKLLSYFDKLYSFQQEALYGKSALKGKPSLTDLTKYLIATELIFEYGGKSVKYDEGGSQHSFNFLPFSDLYENDNVKGCTLNLVGDFLMYCKNGFKDYNFDYTKKKLDDLKADALVNSIACILNNNWNEVESRYMDTLLLNALHYLGNQDINGFESYSSKLILDIRNRVSMLKQRANKCEGNLKRFVERVVPVFQTVIARKGLKDFDRTAFQGQLIYSSLVGYCYVQSVKNQNEFSLIRPGFMWDDSQEEYLKHRPDEVYSTLKLPSFISINLG